MKNLPGILVALVALACSESANPGPEDDHGDHVHDTDLDADSAGDPDSDEVGDGDVIVEDRAAPVLNTTCQQGSGYMAANLSATGCYTDVAARYVVASLVPYEVNSELWADGTTKRRFLSTTGPNVFGFRNDRAWNLPGGTVLMKEFWLQLDPNDAASRRPIETRFLLRRDASSWEGFTYQWNEAGTDATLLTGSLRETYDLVGGGTQDHYFPSRGDCLTCHNASAGMTLGLRTSQMNRDHDYAGSSENQLTHLWDAGYLTADPGAPASAPRLPDPRGSEGTLEQRARSYLAANCSHCHQPGGPTLASLDLRYETTLLDTNSCNRSPIDDLGVTGARIILPGDASKSVLWLRMSQRTSGVMPPLATYKVDEVGTQLIADWIDALTVCP